MHNMDKLLLFLPAEDSNIKCNMFANNIILTYTQCFFAKFTGGICCKNGPLEPHLPAPNKEPCHVPASIPTQPKAFEQPSRIAGFINVELSTLFIAMSLNRV